MSEHRWFPVARRPVYTAGMIDGREDWSRSRARFEAFWRREIVDRCCVAVRAPRKHAVPPPAAEPARDRADLIRSWLDPELNLRRMLADMDRTFHGGEAYPAATMCVGASVMAAFYGARIEYREETVWFHRVLDSLIGHDWEIDLASAPLYRETVAAARYYASESRGRYLVGLPEIGSATDDLSLLRGLEELVLDMLEEPAEAARAIAALAKTWGRVHRELYEIALPANRGGCPLPWMQTWAPGPHYQMSCDFSAVQSPELFRRFTVPEIEAYLRVNEYGVYHWDGPDAIKHLDALLEIDGLRAIQWTPGDGQEPTASPRWLPSYKRIQDSGRCLVLPFVTPREVELLLGELSSRGLFMSVWAASEEEARALLGRVAGWTRA
jgi:hypothetical protein